MRTQYTVGLIVAAALLVVGAAFVSCDATRAQSEEGGVKDSAQMDYECTKSIIIVVSPDKEFVAGFSKYTGVWEKKELRVVEGEELDLLLAEDIAAFQVGDMLLAFSAPKGTWSSVELRRGERAEIMVMHDMAIATIGNRIYAYGAPAAKWDMVEITPAK